MKLTDCVSRCESRRVSLSADFTVTLVLCTLAVMWRNMATLLGGNFQSFSPTDFCSGGTSPQKKTIWFVYIMMAAPMRVPRFNLPKLPHIRFRQFFNYKNQYNVHPLR